MTGLEDEEVLRDTLAAEELSTALVVALAVLPLVVWMLLSLLDAETVVPGAEDDTNPVELGVDAGNDTDSPEDEATAVVVVKPRLFHHERNKRHAAQAATDAIAGNYNGSKGQERKGARSDGRVRPHCSYQVDTYLVVLALVLLDALPEPDMDVDPE